MVVALIISTLIINDIICMNTINKMGVKYISVAEFACVKLSNIELFFMFMIRCSIEYF